jgi:hypothetical protein
MLGEEFYHFFTSALHFGLNITHTFSVLSYLAVATAPLATL